MGSYLSYPSSRVVTTAQGQVQGRRLVYKGDKQVDAFQGIPYAQPPVGQLRFQKPQPPDSWEGIRDATKFGNRAIQPYLLFIERLKKYAPSEDCLYLNVFTPCWEPPSGGFPVMVYLHGGGFVMGDADTYGDIGICENLCTRDVVVVSINYRVAYLGFFTTGDSVCPGNVGLWDQTEALKWVQQNIDAFGGNKDNVTVFGQSAGAASVDFLHLSPHSTDLFHKGICLAGNALAPWAISSNMVEQCRKKARLVGVEEKDSQKFIEKLREVPADKFGINLFAQVDKEDFVDLETTPVIDGDFFPESLEELRKKATPKPLMTGVTKEEGIFFMLWKKNTAEGLSEIIRHALRDAENKERLQDQLHKKYANNRDLKDNQNLLRVSAEVHSDYFMNCPTLRWCERNTDNDQPVYLYIFDHFCVKSIGYGRFLLPILDITHCLELTYLFRKSVFSPFVDTESEHSVENNFSRAFTNFAIFGNPNGGDASRTDLPARWAPIDSRNPSKNFVFTTEGGHMSESYFGGRPADVMAMIQQ
ncbi:hypothetical protein PFISCL1PPCAC_11056 [Pristionchus fissidentatus]|uniref:Carboxylic ester hydrolase n=1 Tax=Pristionchus fissidentatus TaxID=1538716 RepID=A0AAV5VJQ6_9BILA|nr:hypothetical protein PFISCL1PPCAC_11056 [Pristionchus fissidentatus]